MRALLFIVKVCPNIEAQKRMNTYFHDRSKMTALAIPDNTIFGGFRVKWFSGIGCAVCASSPGSFFPLPGPENIVSAKECDIIKIIATPIPSSRELGLPQDNLFFVIEKYHYYCAQSQLRLYAPVLIPRNEYYF